ncbi:hypothetical protein XELAEV_18013972mg [Xenopus laevis]|uniref:GAF domain-containing protein n=1 Tax=Xenopus laevis TaxID=8355 RepID=A0A974DSB2_XENLA|nr:hypothetical protein XELAEV_18013972mg [Xenopus laevis]
MSPLSPLSPLSPRSYHNSLPKPTQAANKSYDELDQKILQLCGELYDLDAASLQIKVIHYGSLASEIESLLHKMITNKQNLLIGAIHSGFVSPERLSGTFKLYLKENTELCNHRIGAKLTFGHLGQVVDKKKSITLQDISSEEHRQLNNMLGFEVHSMLCVPVISRATSQVVALACAFNKQGGKYTEVDEHKIQHCFCYTSTVLTSTLAFQKEQKLKCECQVSPTGSSALLLGVVGHIWYQILSWNQADCIVLCLLIIV